MNLKTLGFYRSLYFVLLSSLGFFYLGFLFLFTPKVYSGFLMQIIFFVDTLIVHPQSISPLVFRPDFIFQILVGLLWTYLLLKIFTSFFRTLKIINHTKTFIQTLNIARITKQYTVIKTSSPQAFTVGFTHSQIFLSQKLLAISTPEEISSILLHEQSHVLNRDPLKNLIIDFIKNLLPPFPFKSWLFGQYQTSVEISCDQFSQTRFSHPTSLISALLKIHQFSLPQFVTGFSAQSERIKILVGQKTLPFRSTLLTGLTVFALIFVVSGSLYRTDVFYQCSHLLKCFENLITPDHIMFDNFVENTHCLSQ